MAGTIPACAGIAAGVLYPHPKLSIASNKTAIIFMVFSSREGYRQETFLAKQKWASVRDVSFSCKEDVDEVSPRRRGRRHGERSSPNYPRGTGVPHQEHRQERSGENIEGQAETGPP